MGEPNTMYVMDANDTIYELVQIGWRHTDGEPEKQIAAGVHFHMFGDAGHGGCERVYVLRESGRPAGDDDA